MRPQAAPARQLAIVPVALVLLLATAGIEAAAAQGPPTATPDTSCSSCTEWNRPHGPVKVFGNTYYVGTDGLTALLVTSPDGHVLVDAALPESAPQILANITALGFRVQDVKVILNSHAHFDHAGGLAALQQATGAPVVASLRSAPWIRAGTPQPDDPQYGTIRGYPVVRTVREIADGDTVRVGPLRLVMTLTPGHTPGGTTWRWQSCEGARCLWLVYADSFTPLSAPAFLYTTNRAYADGPADFPRSIARWRTMPCDLLITPHPMSSNLWARLQGAAPLVDPGACRDYAGKAELSWTNRLAMEAKAR